MVKNTKYILLLVFLLTDISILLAKSKNLTTKLEPQIKDSIFKSDLRKIEKLYSSEKYSESLRKALDLLKKAEVNSNINVKYLCHYKIGEVFRKINNHEKALFHFKKSLELSKFDSNFKDNENEKNNRYAKSLLRTGYEFFKLKKIDSAKYYYSKITTINHFNNELEELKASAYNNLSGIYLHDSLYDFARKHALKSIEIRRKNNNKTYEAAALGNLASIYLEEKKFSNAKYIYLEAINLIRDDQSNKAIRFKEDLYFNLAWTLYRMKDYTAYDYQELSYIIKDSLRDKETRRAVEQVYAQQKIDLEKERTALAKARTKLIKAKDDKTTLLFGALSLLVIIISGGLVYNYKLRKDNLQLKLSENSLKQQQSIEKIKSDAQTKILNATIDGKESERKQIAETLHDNVSALLSSANMHLSATKKQINGVTPLEIEKTQAIILEASQKVRDLSHNLISSILLKFGLEYALKDIAKKFSNSELTFKVSALNINRYNQEFEIKVFNIIQELANNILKHSKATYAQIIIKQEKNQLTVLVNDDGVGFSTSSSSFKNNGIGLNQIEARIKMMNGKFTINSESNKGTKVSIIIPIQQQKPFQFSSVS